MALPTLTSRHRTLLHRLLRDGPLSRSQLHEELALRKNTISDLVEPLMEAGILREGSSLPSPRGRPHTQLEIDPASRRVLGVSLHSGRIEIATLNLLGQLPNHLESQPFSTPERAVNLAAKLLRQHIVSNGDNILRVAVTVPGFMDPNSHMLLHSSLFQGGQPASLQPIYDAVGNTPLILGNITHAPAAAWLLHSPPALAEDVLVVMMEDGVMGSALLIQGRPNSGCVVGSNELGHTRLAVETVPCYCGQTGCIERIFDSRFLKAAESSLAARVQAFDGHDPELSHLIDLIAMGFANAVNFTRVHRLIMISSLGKFPFFAEALAAGVRKYMLRELATRVRIGWWDFPAARPAPAAAALALASLFYQGWQQSPNFAKISLSRRNKNSLENAK